MKVKDILNLKQGLGIINENEFPMALAYKLQKISLKVDEEFEVYQGLRTKLIEKYKEKTLENGNVKIKRDKLPIFNKEHKELTEQDVDIKLDKIKLSDLGETIKPSTLVLIDKIIKEDEVE